jgi:hypothetical protein
MTDFVFDFKDIRSRMKGGLELFKSEKNELSEKLKAKTGLKFCTKCEDAGWIAITWRGLKQWVECTRCENPDDLNPPTTPP